MKLKVGIIIKSTELLNDSMFSDAIILIAEYNNDGALGFVINKPFGRSLNELTEFNESPPFPLYDGGPVDKEHLFFIHCRPDIIKGGQYVSDNIYYAGDFKQAINAANKKVVKKRDIKIFVGYCGWDAEELEKEIEEGSWSIVNETVAVFDDDEL
jgi:putative transcriptional regulator